MIVLGLPHRVRLAEVVDRRGPIAGGQLGFPQLDIAPTRCRTSPDSRAVVHRLAPEPATDVDASGLGVKLSEGGQVGT